LVDSVNAGEDVTGSDRRMVRSLRAVPCRGHRVKLMESDFREFDAFGDAVIHLISPGN
jgi:nucleoside-diphosphate-sugar epimerase